MKTLNIKNSLLVLSIFTLIFSSCKKEENEEEELDMKFKTEAGYTFSDATLPSGTDVKIGIEAETENEKDPLIKFNISESINGGTANTVYSEDLDNKEYEYDYSFTMNDTVSSNTHEYIFTVTNRDGLNAQKRLTITVQ